MLSLGCRDLLCCFLKHSWFSLVGVGLSPSQQAVLRLGCAHSDLPQTSSTLCVRWFGVRLCSCRALRVMQGCRSCPAACAWRWLVPPLGPDWAPHRWWPLLWDRLGGARQVAGMRDMSFVCRGQRAGTVRAVQLWGLTRAVP